MTITTKDIDQAAFWDAGICVECGQTVDDLGEECPQCGGEVFEATRLQYILSRIEREGEEA